MIWLFAGVLIGVTIMAIRESYNEGHLHDLKAWVMRLDDMMRR